MNQKTLTEAQLANIVKKLESLSGSQFESELAGMLKEPKVTTEPPILT